MVQQSQVRVGGPAMQMGDGAGTHTRARGKGSDPVNFLVFLIPALEFVQINVVGTLFGPEILLLFIFVYLLLSGKIRIAAPAARTFIVLCSLWLVSQCATDVVRHAAFADFARGWSNIGMTLVNFAALCTLLYGRPHRLVFYGWGLVVGGILRYYISPGIFAEGDPWKFGFADPVTLAIVLIASSKSCRGRTPVALLAVAGILNIYAGTRMQGGCCLAAAFYLFVTQSMREQKVRGIQLKTGSVVLVAVSMALGLVAVFFAYKYAATTGLLGERARGKYESQSSGKWGVLLGGRTELLGSIPAIYDSPILGHGSWAKDPTYLIAERQALAMMGYEEASWIQLDDLEDGLIPAHSYLFGAWVYGGILGAVFFGWVFWFTAKTLMRVYPSSVTMLPLLSYVGFSTFWNVLFSPYGSEVRIIFPYYVLIFMTCLDMAPNGPKRTAPFKAKRARRVALASGSIRVSTSS
jgi:hypothetical protein